MPCAAKPPHPKTVDQPAFTPSGSRTQNGKFCDSAENYKRGLSGPQSVRVYEKIHQGIWFFNGLFHLVDAWCELDQGRNVFKFKLVALAGDESSTNLPRQQRTEIRRLIPTDVKIEVWRRDNGRCVQCGASDELHFDHVLPYSKAQRRHLVDSRQCSAAMRAPQPIEGRQDHLKRCRPQAVCSLSTR